MSTACVGVATYDAVSGVRLAGVNVSVDFKTQSTQFGIPFGYDDHYASQTTGPDGTALICPPEGLDYDYFDFVAAAAPGYVSMQADNLGGGQFQRPDPQTLVLGLAPGLSVPVPDPYGGGSATLPQPSPAPQPSGGGYTPSLQPKPPALSGPGPGHLTPVQPQGVGFGTVALVVGGAIAAAYLITRD